MTTQPNTDLLYALQDYFEGEWDRDIALALVGLSENKFAIDTWNRWQREMDEDGSYNFVEKQRTKHRVAVQEHYTFTLTTYVEVEAYDAEQATELVETQYNKDSRYWGYEDWSRGSEWLDNVTFEIDE